ncbi:glycosyl hydrolases family 28-domain-containing protein [Leptodontidium sp. MPI-SDFR-AT-0119]|nr:glycosyl hydrolases family 28-domain-containing protein [Leptodontidium sp. MPI-SDFR-AT-0119]
MHSIFLLAALAPLALACTNPDTDPCASVLTASSVAAASFCKTYTLTSHTATTSLPAFATYCSNRPDKISSACSCLVPTGTSTTTLVTTTKAAISSSKTSTPSSSVKTTTPTAKTTTTVGTGTTCTVTEYASITSAVASCTNIVLENISAPASSTILLTKLKQGSTVTFAGKTTFGKTSNDDFNPIEIAGTDITITGAPGHVIDGNGQAYWDGQGSNGGVPKPDHFIVLSKMVRGTITNLNIQNWPVHCFDVTGCTGMTMDNLHLDNSAGSAANSASGGLAAAHNSDGFDFSSSNNVILSNTYVSNQDDCVAVTSGVNVTVTGMTNNVVTDITFSDSSVSNSQNGCRIKTNSKTTGAISGITYKNIVLSGISIYGIDIQQDYLNGGPTGSPTNGVTIDGVTFDNVTGTCTPAGTDYYILCGSGSCADFSYTDISITGGGVNSSCNYPASGCP